MATIRADLIDPTEAPFDVSGFWDDDNVSVSAFSTGIDKCDGEECIIDGCGHDIADCLDHCHIIGPNDRKTVRPPSTTFSICLSDLFPLVEYASTTQIYSSNQQTKCIDLPQKWSLDVQVSSLLVRFLLLFPQVSDGCSFLL